MRYDDDGECEADPCALRPYGPGNKVGDAFGQLRLTPELSRRLRRTAASRRVSVAELVRQILAAGLP